MSWKAPDSFNGEDGKGKAVSNTVSLHEWLSIPMLFDSKVRYNKILNTFMLEGFKHFPGMEFHTVCDSFQKIAFYVTVIFFKP